MKVGLWQFCRWRSLSERESRGGNSVEGKMLLKANGWELFPNFELAAGEVAVQVDILLCLKARGFLFTVHRELLAENDCSSSVEVHLSPCFPSFSRGRSLLPKGTDKGVSGEETPRIFNPFCKIFIAALVSRQISILQLGQEWVLVLRVF